VEKLNCPKCGRKLKVTRTIRKKDFDIRYRKCPKCKKTYKTKEMMYDHGWNYKAIIDKIQDLVEDVD
jgi:ssDNA-binding Zn-finger/Zn-ribbon topoisomerase 1